MSYEWVTGEIFDEELGRLLEEELRYQPASCLLSIPGAYELFSEHFNNEVLKRLNDKKAR